MANCKTCDVSNTINKNLFGKGFTNGFCTSCSDEKKDGQAKIAPVITSQEFEIKRYNAERTKWERRTARWNAWKKEQGEGKILPRK